MVIERLVIGAMSLIACVCGWLVLDAAYWALPEAEHAPFFSTATVVHFVLVVAALALFRGSDQLFMLLRQGRRS